MVLTEQTLKKISKSISCDLKNKLNRLNLWDMDYHVKIQYLKIAASPDTYKEKKLKTGIL